MEDRDGWQQSTTLPSMKVELLIADGQGIFPDSEMDRGIGPGEFSRRNVAATHPPGRRPFRDIDQSRHGRGGRAKLRWIAPRRTMVESQLSATGATHVIPQTVG